MNINRIKTSAWFVEKRNVMVNVWLHKGEDRVPFNDYNIMPLERAYRKAQKMVGRDILPAELDVYADCSRIEISFPADAEGWYLKVIGTK